MANPQRGDTVRVHYTGRLADGTVFDSSEESGPLELTVGDGEVIPGFEEAVVALQPGEQRTVTIPADQAYGPHLPELVVSVDRAEFPSHIDPVVGQALQVPQEDGGAAIVMVAEVSASQVVLDANHPLAGEDLTFDLQLAEDEPLVRER
jgi:peptidylprolyl isomerase